MLSICATVEVSRQGGLHEPTTAPIETRNASNFWHFKSAPEAKRSGRKTNTRTHSPATDDRVPQGTDTGLWIFDSGWGAPNHRCQLVRHSHRSATPGASQAMSRHPHRGRRFVV